MAHTFDVKSFAKLDSPERRSLLPPEKILQQFNLSPGDVVADIGCGIGYFSLPASVIVGSSGKILAMDISAEMLHQVKKRALHSDTNNIETIQIDGENFIMADGSADVVLAFFVLHEASDASHFLAEAGRILKPGGTLALIDWEKRETRLGPPLAHRIARTDACDLLTQAGFVTRSVFDNEADFYGPAGTKSN